MNGLTIMLFVSLGVNAILFGLLLLYRIISEAECKTLRKRLRSKRQ